MDDDRRWTSVAERESAKITGSFTVSINGLAQPACFWVKLATDNREVGDVIVEVQIGRGFVGIAYGTQAGREFVAGLLERIGIECVIGCLTDGEKYLGKHVPNHRGSGLDRVYEPGEAERVTAIKAAFVEGIKQFCMSRPFYPERYKA